jgi:hypothetical protein
MSLLWLETIDQKKGLFGLYLFLRHTSMAIPPSVGFSDSPPSDLLFVYFFTIASSTATF